MSLNYDLIVLGSGPAGAIAALAAAKFGKRVAIVCPRIGGTCINVGCIPKKIMWEAASLSKAMPYAPYFGIRKPVSTVEYGDINWDVLASKRDEVTGRINTHYEQEYADQGVDVIYGYGKFINEEADIQVSLSGQTIRGKTYKKDDKLNLSASYVIIAVGNQAVIPQNVPGAELGGISDTFFSWHEQPRTVAIVGGGYIGTELAQMLSIFGTKVTVITKGNSLLTRFDDSIQERLTAALKEDGVEIVTNATVSAIKQLDNLKEVKISNGTSLQVESVIWAIGRKPQINLGYSSATIKLGDSGEVIIDDFHQTTNPKVYASGDIINKINLTPVGLQTGARISRHLFGKKKIAKYDYDQPYPSVIFTHPEAASVGLTTHEAKQKWKDEVRVYESSYVTEFYGVAPDEMKHKSYYKYITIPGPNDEEKVVGIHLVGDNASEQIEGYAVALKQGLTRETILDTIYVHPTSAEHMHHDF
ncbi:hypothetical protein G9P44_001405 [Scheffersomyces stipitis]|nr:hypothetical protein G9P44_001405 [Scheffersomyces stipitis]